MLALSDARAHCRLCPRTAPVWGRLVGCSRIRGWSFCVGTDGCGTGRERQAAAAAVNDVTRWGSRHVGLPACSCTAVLSCGNAKLRRMDNSQSARLSKGDCLP